MKEPLRKTEEPKTTAARSWWIGVPREDFSKAQEAEHTRMQKFAKPGMGPTIGWGPKIGKTR